MGERISAIDYFAAFLIAAHRTFCAFEIAALAFAENFRFGRFSDSVPIGTTGWGVLAVPGADAQGRLLADSTARLRYRGFVPVASQHSVVGQSTPRP
jgi:hypothetical protein